MAQINVPVSDEVYRGCKLAAQRAGMLFKVWVERTLATHIDPRDIPAEPAERKYIPDEA